MFFSLRVLFFKVLPAATSPDDDDDDQQPKRAGRDGCWTEPDNYTHVHTTTTPCVRRGGPDRRAFVRFDEGLRGARQEKMGERKKHTRRRALLLICPARLGSRGSSSPIPLSHAPAAPPTRAVFFNTLKKKEKKTFPVVNPLHFPSRTHSARTHLFINKTTITSFFLSLLLFLPNVKIYQLQVQSLNPPPPSRNIRKTGK